MSGHDDDPKVEAEAAPAEPEPLTVIAEPVVIDLRDGVDTVAAYEAAKAEKAEKARQASAP